MHCAFGFVLRLSFDEFITFRKTKVNAYLVYSLRYLLYHIIPFNSPWSCVQMSCFARVIHGTRFSTFILISLEYHRPNFDRWIQFDNSQKNLISFFSFLSNYNAKAKAKCTCSNMLVTWKLSKLMPWFPPNQCLLFLNDLKSPMAKFKPKIKGITKIKVKQGHSQAQA